MHLSHHISRLLLLSSLSIALTATPAIAQASTIDSETVSGEETMIISTPAEETSTESTESINSSEQFSSEQLETYETESNTSDTGSSDSDQTDSADSSSNEDLLNSSDTSTYKKSKKSVTFKGYSTYILKYKKGKKLQLNLTSNSDGKLTYVSTNKKIVTVTSHGKITVRGSGICKIKVTSAETNSYKKKTKTIKIKVWKSAKYLNFSSSYKKSVFYRRLTSLRLYRNKRNNLLKVAKSQIGYHECSNSHSLNGISGSDANYTEYGRFYGYNGVPWCAIFVNWVARINRISLSVVPKECAVCNYYSFFHKRGRTHSWNSVRKGNYKPVKGDIILYSNVRGATTHHIGYVQSVTYTNSTVKIVTVEGNQDNAVRKVTMNMKRSDTSGHVNGHYITAFASPNY